ncbi:MAG: glycosyltransferase [Akkermansiaceae bacterium]|nr:glycosyltransferase [Akkermansiaceae bacterium]
MPESDPIHGCREELVVAVCTYRRPHGLVALLNRLSAIEGRDRVIVLVVDNDPDRSAEQVVQDVNAQSGAGALYMHAVPQGLATARNAALDFGGERSLAVLFIDDDEVPEPSWLTSMLSSHKKYPSAIITGPIRPEFAGPLPNWAPDGSFWRKPEYAAGQSLRVPTADANMLFPLKVTIGGQRFDTNFDLAGGQDTHFLLRWLAAKETILWSAQSVVVERIPEERLSLEYARDRAYFSSIAYQHAVESVRGRRRAFDVLRIVRQRAISAFCWLYGKTASSAPMIARAQIRAAAARGTWAGMQGQWVNRWTDYQVDVR